MSEFEDDRLGWVLIPPSIIAAEDLNMGEKVVWGRIAGLIGKRGYCWASNAWLGEQLGYSERTIERYICQLVRKGYLDRAYGYNGKQNRQLIPIPTIVGAIPTRVGKPSLPESGSNREGREKQCRQTPLSCATKGRTILGICDVKAVPPVYSTEFEEAWAVFRELGRNDAKKAAAKAWNARLRHPDEAGASVTAERLIRATRIFGKVMATEGRQPDHILMPQTFFGSNFRFMDYETDPDEGKAEQRAEARIRAQIAGVLGELNVLVYKPDGEPLEDWEIAKRDELVAEMKELEAKLNGEE